MKKLTNVLMSICMLTMVCSLTGCGGEKWEYAEDEGVSVSNSNCSDIVSDKAKENIRKKLEDKYKDVKPKVNEESIKGLIKEEITLEKDDDYYFAESVRAEELDSIFEVDNHTVETYVDIAVYPDENFMEYEIYAQYDNDEDTYCFAEVDFILPDSENKSDEDESEEETTVKTVDFDAFYDSLETKYGKIFDDGFWKFDVLVTNSSPKGISLIVPSEKEVNSFSTYEADALVKMTQEFLDFAKENPKDVFPTTEETEYGTIIALISLASIED